MYNEQLNEQCLQRLRDDVAGKKVLMVGNATTLFSEKYGELIDSHDFVIRFGKGVPYHNFREYLGKKTDLWFFGMARSGMYPQFPSVKHKVLTLSQLPLYKGTDLAVNPDMMSGEFQVYRDFFLAGSGKDTLDCNVEINGGILDARISQGAQCVHWFHNKIKTYSSIKLIGFDFFAEGFAYNYDTNRKDIKQAQHTTSWHMPLASAKFNENPHNKDGNEERYIRSVPNLEVHQMPKPDMAKLEELMKKLRGDKASFIGELP